MLIDEALWPWVKGLHGDQWGVREVKGRRYVVSRGAQQGVVLARVIARAEAGQVVRYVNGDPMDVRRANLRVQSAEAFLRARFA